VGETVALTNVNVELDGNSAEGVISLTRSDRQAVQATLAAEQLDFTPYVETIRLLARGSRDWNRQAFDLQGLSLFDLDMRLSAAKASIGATKLGRTAIGANLRGGKLMLSVGEAQVYGGVLKGSLGIERADAAVDIKSQFSFTDIDLQAGASEMFGFKNLSGRGNLNFTLQASGSSTFALAQSVAGTAALTGRDGAITGFNVEQLLRRLERRPLSGAGNFRSGNTPFDTLNIALNIKDGIATAENARVEGPTARLLLNGTASIPARDYDLKGVASLMSAGDAPPAFELPFVVQGPWDDPLVLPDSDSLIRRSPASAPLLDSLKDRKTRDAVKSVIDRLTGTRTAPGAGSPAQPAPAAASGGATDAPPAPAMSSPTGPPESSLPTGEKSN
jgi:AsmA protein